MGDKLQVLENVPLLARLGEELMKSLAERAEFVAVKKGDLAVQENNPGDALFAVVSDRLQAFTKLGSGRERVFATYCNSDCFGEMIAEAKRCLQGGVVASKDNIDAGMIFGTGFPPFRGGGAKYARDAGLWV